MSTHLSPINLLLYMMMMLSSLMVLSSNNLLLAWTALEINMISFIPMMMSSNKFQESEAMLKYFLMQAIGSSMFLMMSSALWWFDNSMNKNLIMILFIFSLLIKLGMAPCHMWFPSVMTSMSWISCMILSTWQKLAPLTMLMFNMSQQKLIIIIPMLNALVGSTMGMNQSKLKSIMAFSSITHMGWMSSFMLINKPMYSMLYLAMYSLIMVPSFLFMYKNSMYTLNNKIISYMPLFILLMSISGIPPFMGFMPKLMTIYMMIQQPAMVMILLISSIMNLFFYLNISFSIMLSKQNMNYIENFKQNKNMLIMATATLPMMFMLTM